ncbi:MAG: response regulator [Cyanobacteriota bacterium]|nr:response regulator [Cyanobacteriota bacterium]
MKTVLIIDDDISISTLIRKLLRKEGFWTVNAENGAEGVRVAKNIKPDLILCDIVMPMMNGYEVIEQLQQDPETKGIPFLFLSSKSTDKDIRKGIQLGSDCYVTKPIDIEELLSAIRSRLSSPPIDQYQAKALHLSDMQRSNLIYSRLVEPKLGKDYQGWYVAIEVETGRCFLGKTQEQAHGMAQRCLPSKVFYYRQIGIDPCDIRPNNHESRQLMMA